MAAVTGLTLVKAFPYRDNPSEEFSNTYHFKGPPPGDDASWLQLANDVISHENKIFDNEVRFVRAWGYNSDDLHAPHVFSHDFTLGGTPPTGVYPSATGNIMAGDQAALIEWRVQRKTAKGKPVFLRKYMHRGYTSTAENDQLDSSYRDQLILYAGTTGIQAVHGGLRSRLFDDNVAQAIASLYVTTRTLKRRGKRKRP